MSIILFAQLTIISLMNALAQVFLKKSGIIHLLDWHIFLNKYLWLGGALYVAGFFWWVKALNQGQLTVVVPYTTSLMYIATVFLGWYFFKEQVTPIKVAGILAICVGMFLIMKK